MYVLDLAPIKEWKFTMPSAISLSELGSDRVTLIRFAVLQDRMRFVACGDAFDFIIFTVYFDRKRTVEQVTEVRSSTVSRN